MPVAFPFAHIVRVRVVFRAVVALAMEETGRLDNPARKLKRKPVRRKVRRIPAAEDVRNPLKLFSGVCVVRDVKRRKAAIVFVAEDILKACVYSVCYLSNLLRENERNFPIKRISSQHPERRRE